MLVIAHFETLQEGRSLRQSYRHSKVELQSQSHLLRFRQMLLRRRTRLSCTSSQKSELLFFLSLVEDLFAFGSSVELEEERLTSLSDLMICKKTELGREKQKTKEKD